MCMNKENRYKHTFEMCLFVLKSHMPELIFWWGKIINWIIAFNDSIKCIANDQISISMQTGDDNKQKFLKNSKKLLKSYKNPQSPEVIVPAQ